MSYVPVRTSSYIADNDALGCVEVLVPIESLIIRGCINLKSVLGADKVTSVIEIAGSPRVTLVTRARPGRRVESSGVVRYIQ